MISTNDLRRGMYIEMDNVLYSVVESQHIKPGKGGAFVRCKLRNMKSGSMFEKTLNAGEKVKSVDLEQKDMQYMYRKGDRFFFLDQETYEEISVTEKEIGENVKFLKEDTIATALFYNEAIFGIELPIVVELEIKETVPGIRGNTVSGGSKPAVIETGATIQVPLFINAGDKIKVDTRTGEYLERS